MIAGEDLEPGDFVDLTPDGTVGLTDEARRLRYPMLAETEQAIRDFFGRCGLDQTTITSTVDNFRVAMKKVRDKRPGVVFDERVEVTQRFDCRVSGGAPIRRYDLMLVARRPNVGRYFLHIGEEVVRKAHEASTEPPSQEGDPMSPEVAPQLLELFEQAHVKPAEMLDVPSKRCLPVQAGEDIAIGDHLHLHTDKKLYCLRSGEERHGSALRNIRKDEHALYDLLTGLYGFIEAPQAPPNVEPEPAPERSPSPSEESWRQKPPLF